MFEEKSNVFGQSDEGFQSNFDNALARARAAEGESRQKWGVTRVKRQDYDAPMSMRARVIGTVLATCALFALIAVPMRMMNERGLLGGGEPEGTVLAPGAEGTEEITETEEYDPDYYYNKAIEKTKEDSLFYKNMEDDFTPLETVEEIYALAYTKIYEMLWEANYPAHYSRDTAQRKVARMIEIAEEYAPMVAYGPHCEDELDYAKIQARSWLEADHILPWEDTIPWRSHKTETELPWYNGTNADAPVVRYKAEDAPEEVRAFIPRLINSTYDSAAGSFEIDGRFWYCMTNRRTDLAIGYSRALNDNDHSVYLFYLNEEQQQEDAYIIVSVSVPRKYVLLYELIGDGYGHSAGRTSNNPDGHNPFVQN